WLSRPVRDWGQREAVRLGVPFPPEEELDQDILLKRGVPAAAIHLYGDGVTSTYAEAAAFEAAARPAGKSVLVVTSRWHARRAGMIFRRVLKGSVVRVAGAADPGFSRRWWSDSEMAYAAVLETAKTLWWLAGGRFGPKR
ncbi:MAG: YdcF family protein, partial [Elusimicrobia bacterium]|nr:YdcF family protein [Elusimicrobiota bacterium]